MNAVEIEEAVSKLADQPFDPEQFPFAFLEAYGNKQTTLDRLRKGDSNKSSVAGGILQRNNIHTIIGEIFRAMDTRHKVRSEQGIASCTSLKRCPRTCAAPTTATMRPWSASNIGRRFKNDTERLEKLFALYTEMTAQR